MCSVETVGTEFQMNNSNLLVKSRGEELPHWCFLLDNTKHGVTGSCCYPSSIRNVLLLGFLSWWECIYAKLPSLSERRGRALGAIDRPRKGTDAKPLSHLVPASDPPVAVCSAFIGDSSSARKADTWAPLSLGVTPHPFFLLHSALQLSWRPCLHRVLLSPSRPF